MRISFDLDDTLICYQACTPREPPLSWWGRLFVHDEPLRFGARRLMTTLHQRGWDIWIYTTSYRDPWSVWMWLRLHGIRVSRVINQDRHEREMKRLGHHHWPSKNPSVFRIDWHIDDSEGVAEEGRRHGFGVVVVLPNDPDWAKKISKRLLGEG